MMKVTGKRLVTALVCTVLLVCLLPVNAWADTGPKPSVHIAIENMDGRECYGTLLSKSASTGPASAWDGEEEASPNFEISREIWRAFVDYKDPDGFYFLQWGWRCDEAKGFSWDYYPPDTFKILLYYPDTGEFVSSGVLERYAFDTYYTAKLDGGTMTVHRSYNFGREIVGLLARIVLTVAIEVAVALLFGFREKKLLRLIVLVNVVTQAALNAALFYTDLTEGPGVFLLLYVLLELAVFIVEAVVYCLTFRRVTERWIFTGKIVAYALAANLCSLAVGFGISWIIPAIF